MARDNGSRGVMLHAVNQNRMSKPRLGQEVVVQPAGVSLLAPLGTTLRTSLGSQRCRAEKVQNPRLQYELLVFVQFLLLTGSECCLSLVPRVSSTYFADAL